MEIETALEYLVEHMEWADALVWTAILSSDTAVSDAGLRERLYHVHATQYGFLQVWTGNGTDLEPEGFQDTVELGRWARQFYAQLRSDARVLPSAAADAPIPAALTAAAEAGLGPGVGAASMGDTLLQVVTHGLYHRGQICMRLRELGCEPPLTEYFAWVWRGKPRAPWPSDLSRDAPN